MILPHLQYYFNKLSISFIDEQLQYFPNLMQVINFYIVASNNLFESVILHNDLPITDMLPF